MKSGASCSGFMVQLGLGRRDLLLGTFVSLGHCGGASVDRLLAPAIQCLKNGKPCLTEAGFVFGRTGSGGSGVGARLLYGPLGQSATLGKNGFQRLVNYDVIHAIKHQKKHPCGDGAEQ
jgi:hypothetical protein